MWKSTINKGNLNTWNNEAERMNTEKPHKQRDTENDKNKKVENNLEFESFPPNM